MKFLIVLAIVGLAAADVSHLTSSYLPPRVSSSVVNYNQGSDAIISRPLVNTYSTHQHHHVQPEITYSRQVNVVPSVQVVGGGYDNGFIGSDLVSNGLVGGGLGGGYYGNGGLISAYDSGLSGGNIYQGGLIDSGYQSSGLIGGGLVSGGLVGGGLSGLSGINGYSGLGGGSNIIRTVSSPITTQVSTPIISNTYESPVDTQYGSNGGYVYEKKH